MIDHAADVSDADTAGYRQLEVLNADGTFLCCDISGNVVVLKRLEDDCLHRNQLHPNIKDRLGRVRELAHPNIAVLRTVERWNGLPFLVWTYLDGEPFDQAIAARSSNVPNLCSQLAAAVDALHELGIVHGGIHANNVIVRPNGRVWLTHVSPYLYADSKADISGVAELLRSASVRFSGDSSERMLHLIHQLEEGELSLREISHMLPGVETGRVENAAVTPIPEQRRRFSSISIALGVTLFGAGSWVLIHRHIATAPAAAPAVTSSVGNDQ